MLKAHYPDALCFVIIPFERNQMREKGRFFFRIFVGRAGIVHNFCKKSTKLALKFW